MIVNDISSNISDYQLIKFGISKDKDTKLKVKCSFLNINSSFLGNATHHRVGRAHVDSP